MKAKEIMANVLEARGLPCIDNLHSIVHHLCERMMDAVDYPNSYGASAILGGVSSKWSGYHPIEFYLSEENFQDKNPWGNNRNINEVEGSYPHIEFTIEDFSSIEECFQLKTVLGDEDIWSIGYYISGTGNTLAVFIKTPKHTIYGFHQYHIDTTECGWNESSSNYSDEDMHVLDVE